jgi:hypothetical protein
MLLIPINDAATITRNTIIDTEVFPNMVLKTCHVVYSYTAGTLAPTRAAVAIPASGKVASIYD